MGDRQMFGSGGYPEAKDRKIVIVSSCDQGYFPLVKGLFLSLLQDGGLPDGFSLGFVDIGCDDASLAWMRSKGIAVRQLDAAVMGELCDPRLGYRRGQICRPFLPALFPEAETVAWMDSDIWVQDVAGVLRILVAADDNRDKVLVSPEFHFTYERVMDFELRRRETIELNEALYGPDTALEMTGRPSFNSGFFAIAREHPIWSEWAEEVRRIYLRTEGVSSVVLHFAEQTSLNYLLRRRDCAAAFDPTYNYLCLWTMPFRDGAGTVRIAQAPHLPLGVIHLAGGWSFFGAQYIERGLLYNSGKDLTPDERELLERSCKLPDIRYA